MSIIVPDVVKIYEGADKTAPKDVLQGETYDFRVGLVQSDGTIYDTTSATLTCVLYNSAGSSVVITPILTKDLNELGIVKVAGISWNTVGVFKLYIVATVGAVVKKFGPYKVGVGAL